MKALEKTYTLSNGVKIPQIGFGTWQIKEGDEAYDSVLLALKNGYRHIDTAAAYGNEVSVGKAVKDSGISREEIFITSKLRSAIRDYDDAVREIKESLERLDTPYIDLYLIHHPTPWTQKHIDFSKENVEIWRAITESYERGELRSIGISNFNIAQTKNLIDNSHIVPMVNQIPYFIGLDQKEIIDYCNLNNIFIEAYSPLGIGFLLDNEDIKTIADKYNKTVAQVCIKYLLQKNTAPLPKSTHEHRMIENSDVDFDITKEDMDFLDTIKGDPRVRRHQKK